MNNSHKKLNPKPGNPNPRMTNKTSHPLPLTLKPQVFELLVTDTSSSKKIQKLRPRQDNLNPRIAHKTPTHRIPQVLEWLIMQDLRYNQRPMERGVAVHGSCNSFHLTFHTSCLILAVANNAEAAHSLTIQPHVLGIALTQSHTVTISYEGVDGASVSVAIATGKTLQQNTSRGGGRLKWKLNPKPYKGTDGGSVTVDPH